MKKALKIILIAGIALLFTIIMSSVRKETLNIGNFVNLPIQIMISSCLFFVYTLLCLAKFKAIKSYQTALLIVLGSSLILLPVSIISYKDVHPTVILEILIQYISISAAYFVFTSRYLVAKIAISTLTAAIALWMTFYGSYLYIDYRVYGNWIGHVSEQVGQPVEFQDSQGQTLSLEDYRGSYLVLDCWNTWCGVCYEKFPDLQATYEKYKDNPEITVGALHFRSENKDETYRTGYDIIQERGFTFPVFSIKRDLPVIKELW